MAFNLKKYAQVTNYDKMLSKQTKDLDLEAKENPTNYNGLLDSDRVGDAVDKTSTYENHLSEAREGDDSQVIAEKAMDKATGLTSRHDDGEPLMDYHKKGEKEQRKAFNASEFNKSKGQRVVDKNPGEQLLEKGNKPMTGNVQPSQLLSNYDTRAEFEKAHKMASKKLATADAILYSIYRKAADENRQLTKIENKNIETISKEKSIILAQMHPGTMPGNRRLPGDGNVGDVYMLDQINQMAEEIGIYGKDVEHYKEKARKMFNNLVATHGPEYKEDAVWDVLETLENEMYDQAEEDRVIGEQEAAEDRRTEPGPMGDVWDRGRFASKQAQTGAPQYEFDTSWYIKELPPNLQNQIKEIASSRGIEFNPQSQYLHVLVGVNIESEHYYPAEGDGWNSPRYDAHWEYDAVPVYFEIDETPVPVELIPEELAQLTKEFFEKKSRDMITNSLDERNEPDPDAQRETQRDNRDWDTQYNLMQ